jgi:hypothetical protein
MAERAASSRWAVTTTSETVSEDDGESAAAAAVAERTAALADANRRTSFDIALLTLEPAALNAAGGVMT